MIATGIDNMYMFACIHMIIPYFNSIVTQNHIVEDENEISFSGTALFYFWF